MTRLGAKGCHRGQLPPPPKVPNDTQRQPNIRKEKRILGSLKLSTGKFTLFIRTIKLKFRMAFRVSVKPLKLLELKG